jgi:hypothetical protein
MSAPSIISSSPADGTTDIVLGTKIVVGFDQPMDTTTLNSSTFSLTGPGTAEVIAQGGLISEAPKFRSSRYTVPGTFSFATDTNGNTILTFTPSEPLRPDVVYTVLIVGPGQLASTSAKNTDGETLDSNYQWSFTTGDLDISTPPATSPLPLLNIPLDPSQIKIQEKVWAVGNDLSQEIVITFPAPIDTTSVTPDQILLSLEPILNDPFVPVPSGLTPNVVISGNKITITISGWPSS